jgi:beta-lactamase superfamily II metal-dependent hydrolase
MIATETVFNGVFRTMRALAAIALVVLMSGADAPPKRNLDIYFIDVNGGAATLVVTPEGESVLIDSGWSGFQDRDPIRIEKVLKEQAKLDHLDHLVTTHWHADHFGGVEGIVKRLRVDHFWDRGLPDPKAPDQDRANYPDGPLPGDALGERYRKASEGKRTALKAGDKLPLKGLDVVVLASGGKVIDGPSSPINPLCESAPADQPVDKSDNARSLAFRFQLGDFTFLDCGDLTWNVEKQLVCPVDKIGPIDVFQVTHHGMDISNHPTLVRTIAPKVAIMNNGPRKGGAAATVKLLRSIPSIQASYQLHKNASTSADDNADPKRIANASTTGGEFIHVSVEPDGSSFTVQVGSDGPIQTFQAK